MAAETELFPGAVTWEFQRQWQGDWYPYVPSIAEGPDGYAALIGTNNTVRPKGAAPQPDDWRTATTPGGVVFTRNYFSLLDDHLRPIEWVEEPQPNLPLNFPHIQGVGEPRLCWQNGAWRWAGMSRQHLDSGIANAVTGTVGSPEVEIVPARNGEWVKNPMPSKIGIIDLYHQTDPPQHGSGVAPYNDGFLCIVHRYEHYHRPGMFSEHRFALLDARGIVERLSGPFRFSDWPLDIVAGIVFHHGDVVLSYSRQDRETYLVRIPLHEVLDWIEETA